MDPHDDKDFLLIKTLYEEQNITHTAKKLFISQPAISDRLKRLEAEFGCQLFIRQPRGILFTSQGEMLVQYVNEADERYQKSAAPLQNPWEKPLVPFPSPAPTYLPSTTCQAF